MMSDSFFFNDTATTEIYTALALGMLWLHDPRDVSMDAAASTVKFVYQQF